ncbi:MAG TPA: methylated-DNA--[protein]-cysteine S-methyltransferase [Candidatus Nitrosopolaris sp.]|nr:methylated-DNA--[protein]-cysteine S-methyltransferase [Candidatus Nitrosopolaris sp.]
MAKEEFALFDTTIGRCGIAWSGAGIVGVQLPEASEGATRSRVLRRFPEARETPPPADVQRAVDDITALLRGEARDLSGIVLDMERVSPFHRRVYEAARTVPAGATLSYGDVAARLGAPGAARAVGQALGRNPFAIVVPCHRVLAAGGRTGGFSASGGIATKLRMLSIEGAQPGLFDDDGAFGCDPCVAVEHLRAADAALARLIDAVGPFRLQLKKTSSTFAMLAEAIVHQQLTGKAAATIFGRVCALFPRAHHGPTAEHILRVSDQRLRSAGLSRAKVLSLRDLAQRDRSGELPSLAELRRMDDEAIVERLIQVRGIGRWTVEMLLIFRLGRPDVLPTDDYGIRKGFAAAFRTCALPARADLEKRGARWKPYRTVASWYLWRAAERAA